MSAVLPAMLESWLTAETADATASLPDWLEDQRHDALQRLRHQPLPSMKDEAWRYTSLKSLLDQQFRRSSESITALVQEDVEDVLIPGLDSHRVVLVNGRFCAELSKLDDLPPGAQIRGLAEQLRNEPAALRERVNQGTRGETRLFTALNTAALDDGVVVLVGSGVLLERPIELIHLSLGLDDPRVAQPRQLIELGAGANATLIERYLSLGESLYCTNSVAELSLGPDASLRHQRIQMESPNAFHIAGLYLHQGAGSRYQGVNIALGGRWARTELSVSFGGGHAECDLLGLYLAGDGQLTDFHLDVNHSLPNCTSRETFKGILYGKGRAVFDGLVYVAQDAQKTDAAMSNRNLMLSEQAEVDTKPQLEINADDVKCSHGTTVGQIEPEMLFYLRSRGISAALARRMLCLGFAGEIIDTLGSEALRDHVAEAVGRRLELAPSP